MKQKKALVIICIFLIGVVGVTIAYFITSASFSNIFTATKFKTTTTETFTSPSDWKPGEEIPKEIVTTNEGDVDAAVRLSYTEIWMDKDGRTLNNVTNNPAIINFQNQLDWTKEGKYYYYKYPLKPGETTSSLIKSITLNDQLGSDHYICTESGNTQECKSELGSLKGGTYILRVTKETVQFDSYKAAWNTNLDIEESNHSFEFVNRQNEGSITVGDLVKVDNQEFYVFSTNSNKTELITRYNLNVGEINSNVIKGVQDSSVVGLKDGVETYGNIAFSYDDYWKNKVGSGLTYSGTVDTDNSNALEHVYFVPYPYVYDNNSNLYKYIESYKNNLESIGINVSNTRLMTYSEAISFGCSAFTLDNEGSCLSAPSWLYETTFWLGNSPLTNNAVVIFADGTFNFELINGGHSSSIRDYDDYYDYKIYNRKENSDVGLRPIIEVDTSLFNN